VYTIHSSIADYCHATPRSNRVLYCTQCPKRLKVILSAGGLSDMTSGCPVHEICMLSGFLASRPHGSVLGCMVNSPHQHQCSRPMPPCFIRRSGAPSSITGSRVPYQPTDAPIDKKGFM
jgi:hypothetical protein